MGYKYYYLHLYHILLSYAPIFGTSMVNKSLMLNTGLAMPLPYPAMAQRRSTPPPHE